MRRITVQASGNVDIHATDDEVRAEVERFGRSWGATDITVTITDAAPSTSDASDAEAMQEA